MEKYFTLEAANRSLTLVRPIVSDILTKMRDAESVHAEVKYEKSQPSASEASLLDKIARAEKLLNEIEYHMKEMEQLGVLLKDLKIGLVDFPCLYQNRVVYLCWRLDEAEIKSWHEVDRGYGDRKPIDKSFSTPALFSERR
jgi:hypothetical protein